MYSCQKNCIQCTDLGVIPVNPAGYHKTCKDLSHVPNNAMALNCIHCKSTVLIIKENLKCETCDENAYKVFNCKHKFCQNCYKTCSTCYNEFCMICSNDINECIDCKNNWAEYKQIKCLKCEQFGFVWLWKSSICENCADSLCNDCRKRYSNSGEIEEKKNNCRNCEEYKNCTDCNQKFCRICGKIEKFIDNSFNRSKTASNLNFCDNCKFKENNLKQKLCGHKLCTTCYGNNHCKACTEKTTNNSFISFNSEQIKCKNCSIMINKNDLKCNDFLCKNCLKTENSDGKIIKYQINPLKPCDDCKSLSNLIQLSCTHSLCTNCNNKETCSLCKNLILSNKCQNCQKYPIFNQKQCGHYTCEKCDKNKFCKQCPSFKCYVCTNLANNLIAKNCGDKLCKKCFDSEKSENCKLCRKKICKNCCRIFDEEKKFNCNHQGCKNCVELNSKCFKCLLKNKPKDKNIIDRCYRCTIEKTHGLKLLCSHQICFECSNNFKVKNTDYYCGDCYLKNQPKICNLCKKSCHWDNNLEKNDFVKKNCCDNYYCRFCLRKRSWIRRKIWKCKCSHEFNFPEEKNY